MVAVTSWLAFSGGVVLALGSTHCCAGDDEPVAYVGAWECAATVVEHLPVIGARALLGATLG